MGSAAGALSRPTVRITTRALSDEKLRKLQDGSGRAMSERVRVQHRCRAWRCADTSAQPVERAMSGPENRKERQREQNTGARRALNVVKQKLQGSLTRRARLWLWLWL